MRKGQDDTGRKSYKGIKNGRQMRRKRRPLTWTMFLSQYASRASKDSLSTPLPTTLAKWIFSHRRPRSPRGRPSANCVAK